VNDIPTQPVYVASYLAVARLSIKVASHDRHHLLTDSLTIAETTSTPFYSRLHSTMPPHPFDPLTPDEISRAAAIVRPHFGQQQDVNFRVITLQEPPKKDMILFMESSNPKDRPTRHARVDVVVETADKEEKFALFELLVDLDQGKVVAKQHHAGKHSYIDTEFMQRVEKACLADGQVKEQISGLGLPEGAQVVVEPWAYATDGENDMRRRVSMVSGEGWC
jgi:primary-amine oxidase